MTTPIVSVVIVSYNSAGVIRACLESLAGFDGHEVILVDNLSVDDTVAIVRRDFPSVRVIENDNNAGFSRAVNLGAHHARGRHLLLLNPDAYISAATIDALAAKLDADATIGAVSPLLEHEGSELVIVTAGHAPTIGRMFLHQSGLSRLGSRIPALEGHYLFVGDLHGEPRDVDWTSGGCLMVPLPLWQRLGGLSDRWFMYAEDVELCLRIRNEGLRVVVDPGLHATHAMGGSSSDVDGRVSTVWITNLFDLYGWRLGRGPAQQNLWRLIVLAGMYGRTAWFTLSALRPGRAAGARAQIRRFRIYAEALRRAPLTADREPFPARAR